MSTTEQYVNFGAGDPVDGWINLDPSPHFLLPRSMHIALSFLGVSSRSPRFARADYRFFRFSKGRSLPLASSSVRSIYSSHVLEHLPSDVVPALFAEFARVLVPDGVVRIVVPDLAAMAESALALNQAWIPLDLKLGTLPAEVSGSRVRSVLEGLMGFPSLHRTAISVRALAPALGPNWEVHTGLRYMESRIPAEKLERVEVPERFDQAIAFELVRT